MSDSLQLNVSNPHLRLEPPEILCVDGYKQDHFPVEEPSQHHKSISGLLLRRRDCAQLLLKREAEHNTNARGTTALVNAQTGMYVHTKMQVLDSRDWTP